MKLSHSQINKFLECGRAYKLHYIDKIRSPLEPSPLTFGSAIDKAFSRMLVPLPGDTEEAPYKIFQEEWSRDKILTENFKFSKSDIDEDLLGDTEASLCTEPQKAFHSLYAKGNLMLKTLREKLMPQIEEVLGVQVPIVLKNQDESGDEVIGYIDFIIRLKGYPTPIIGDLKTSSVLYTPESVKESQQLTIYTFAKGEEFKTRLAGFFVLGKKIKKNKKKICTECGHENTPQAKSCTKENVPKMTSSGVLPSRCSGALNTTMNPEAELTIIIDEIPLEKEDEILTTIDTAHKDIKEGKFDQNFSSCTNKYFQKCCYYSLCHEGKTDGLLDYSKKSEDK